MFDIKYLSGLHSVYFSKPLDLFLFADVTIEMFKFLLVTLVCVTLIIPKCDGNCVWYGVCYQTEDDIEDGGKAYNCPYNGPGYPLKEDQREAQEIMQRICPELYTKRK